MGMKMQPKSERNIESGNPSSPSGFLDLFAEELAPSRLVRKRSTIRWLLQQSFAENLPRQKTVTDIDNQTIENLIVEVGKLRDELKTHTDLLKISNDLLLELNANLKIQESQSYFWSDSWIEAEHHADEDIKNKDVNTFESADQIIEFLRQPE